MNSIRARWLTTAAASLAALFLLWPTRGESYAFLGGQLDLSQRDVRVFVNFSAPEANDSTAQAVEFPGATGAVLAVWKATVEWGSELHGSGQGDPAQPFGLGSGGANFDFVFQGVATEVGTTDDNIVSEITGGGGGTLAFCETPIQDGWRIRFWSGAAVWDDGPGEPSAAGGKDLQGVATHELGHALGLAHSLVQGAVMKPNVQGTLTSMRALRPDDRDGIQALYGVRQASKPHVAGYALSGSGRVAIQGTGFAAQDNEVWFAPAAPGDGTPVKVVALASSGGGTRLDLAIPAAAGAGDLFVRIPGQDGSALSNAFPFDGAHDPCVLPAAFGTAKTTSAGGEVHLSWSGSPSALTGDFAILASGAPFNAQGVLFYGHGEAAIPFYGGVLNLAGPYARVRPVAFDFVGSASVPVPVDPSMSGTTRWYQVWFQDPGDPFGVGLSDGLRVPFCP